MINSYCDSLNETFAQMVYYGILKEEDAQCFRVQSSIEGGSFVLAAGAVLLALLNTFVVKATVQYFRDTDELEENEKEIDEERCLMSDYCSNIEVNGSELNTSERIHPVPVVFTDTFRWLLRRQDDLVRGSQGRIIPEIICESNVCLQQNPTTTPYYRGNVDNSNGGTPKSFKSRKRSETSVCLNAEHPGQDIVLEKELADQPRC